MSRSRPSPHPPAPWRTRRRWGLALLSSLALLAAAFLTAAGTSDPPVPREPGARSPLHVVGIGDSVTAGTACDCVDFVRLYAIGLTERGTPAVASNFGAGGLTATQLLAELQRPGTLRSAVADGDVLLVTIGANDLQPELDRWGAGGCPAGCWSPEVARVAGTVGQIVSTARALHGPGQRVLVTDYWNVFDDGDEAVAARGAAYLAWSDQLSRALNTALCGAARRGGATCVDLYTPFKGDGSRNPTPLLAADGDHPNAAGHRLIAGALLAASGG